MEVRDEIARPVRNQFTAELAWRKCFKRSQVEDSMVLISLGITGSLDGTPVALNTGATTCSLFLS